jgi:hypothetical protein
MKVRFIGHTPSGWGEQDAAPQYRKEKVGCQMQIKKITLQHEAGNTGLETRRLFSI